LGAAAAAPAPASSAGAGAGAAASPGSKPSLARQGSSWGADAAPAGPTLSTVVTMLRDKGLKSSQLALFIDCTKSNIENGKKSFGGRSLHDVSEPSKPNPYQQVISIIAKTLAPFDADGFIPCFGFGDLHTTDKKVFAFFDEKAAPGGDKGFDAVLGSYAKKIVKTELSGPMSFGPAIRKTMELVKKAKPAEFTICLILCDGQPNTKGDTEKAISDASALPIAIVAIGIGDGPWDMMRTYDDKLHARKFDNFNFVCYNDVIKAAKEGGTSIAAALAMDCLCEIPSARVRRRRARARVVDSRRAALPHFASRPASSPTPTTAPKGTRPAVTSTTSSPTKVTATVAVLIYKCTATQ
jgi:E3 ubiquitin-protein ligase RGLG